MAAPDETSPSAAMALREAFGDRKLPDITRKITACVACRKQKIKCHMTSSTPPCTRCRKRGLSCTVNKSLQMLLENDVSWKDSMERRMCRIEDLLEQTASTRPLVERSRQTPQEQRLDDTDMEESVADQDTPSTSQAYNVPQSAWEVVMDPSCGPGAIPASCVSEVSNSPAAGRQSNAGHRPDVISRGLISLATAEKYFDLYYKRLDHFLYSILADNDSLASIRAKSPLLTSVICAVGALHSASSDYQPCYQAFKLEFTTQMFSKNHTFDDVRALCIGAFWLSDISWTLVGAAVRIATEINLHRCITKIPHVKKDCYLRTRLYFLVYVCDHHFSVAYGRPPMTREFGSLGSALGFLNSEYATENDARLVSQVEIWSINSKIIDTFGVDTEMPVPEELFPPFRRLSIALDTWRADWNDRFQTSEHVGRYPKKGVGLHYHFAKLFLCSHVFRGPQHGNTSSYEVPAELEEFANTAIHSASSILRTIVTDSEMQSYLDGLPAYFDTMIAFASVFLLKMTQKRPSNTKVDKEEILTLLQQLVSVLKAVTSRMHPQHLLSSIAGSIGKLLDRSQQSLHSTSVSHVHNNATSGVLAPPADQDWFVSPSDTMFLDNYDFLWPQDSDLTFDFSELNNMQPPG